MELIDQKRLKKLQKRMNKILKKRAKISKKITQILRGGCKENLVL